MSYNPFHHQIFRVANLQSPIICPLCSVLVPAGEEHSCAFKAGGTHYRYTNGNRDDACARSEDDYAKATAEKIRQILEDLKAKQPPPPPPPPPPEFETRIKCKGLSTIMLRAMLFKMAGAAYAPPPDRFALTSAYKKAAFKTHPDHGGTREEFDKLIAIRDELRKRGVLA